MKNRKIIMFFLSWSAVFIAVLLYLPERSLRVAETIERRILDGDADKIDALEISRINGEGVREKLILKLSGERWMMTSPISAEADRGAVRRLIDMVAFAEASNRLTESDVAKLGRKLSDFGLDGGVTEMRVQSGERQETIVFGRKTPAGNEVYAGIDGCKTIVTISEGVRAAVLLPIESFRRKRLFGFRANEVTGIDLRKARRQFAKLILVENGWRMSDKDAETVDRESAERLLQALCSNAITAYEHENVSRDDKGLGDDEAFSVTIHGGAAMEKVAFGKTVGSNEVYAVTAEGALVRIDADVVTFCIGSWQKLRDFRIFPVVAKDVLKVSIASGHGEYVFSRGDANANWMLQMPISASADAGVAGKIVDRILEARNADLCGGTDGGIKISVATAVTNFPAIVLAEGFFPPELRLDDLRDRTMLKVAKSKVRRITVKTATGISWRADRRLEMFDLLESGITATGVETAIANPAEIRRCGISEPSYVITIDSDDEASPRRLLLIGNTADCGGRYATVGGADAIFILSPEIISVLTTPESEERK